MKPFIFLIAAATCLPASAAINSTGKKLADNPDFTLKEFSYENRPTLYLCEEGASGGYEFTIFDGTFNEIKKFSTPSYPEVTANYTRARAAYGPIGITSTYEDYTDYNFTNKEDFAEYVAGNGCSIDPAGNHGDETWYIPGNEGYYFYYEIFGSKYPDRIYIWNNKTNEGFRRDYRYDYESYGQLEGVYETPETISDSRTPRPEWTTPKDANCVDYDSFILSQTLFNNDADFEWIVPIFEAIDCSYTNEYEKVEGKQIYCTGFRIESENGSVVATVKFPSGFYSRYANEIDSYLYMMDGKNYLLVNVQNLDQTEVYYIVYEIDSSKASVKAIDSPRRVSVAPTMTDRGNNVNVTLDAPAKTACKVIVTSVAGQIVMTRNIEPGMTNATIDTSRFAKGLYIVSVSDGKTTRENTKIVVR